MSKIIKAYLENSDQDIVGQLSRDPGESQTDFISRVKNYWNFVDDDDSEYRIQFENSEGWYIMKHPS